MRGGFLMLICWRCGELVCDFFFMGTKCQNVSMIIGTHYSLDLVRIFSWSL